MHFLFLSIQVIVFWVVMLCSDVQCMLSQHRRPWLESSSLWEPHILCQYFCQCFYLTVGRYLFILCHFQNEYENVYTQCLETNVKDLGILSCIKIKTEMLYSEMVLNTLNKMLLKMKNDLFILLLKRHSIKFQQNFLMYDFYNSHTRIPCRGVAQIFQCGPKLSFFSH